MWTARALLLIALAVGPAACLLAVSTSGLAGDPLDAAATPETSSPDASDASSDATSTDVRDAFVLPDGSTVYSGNGHAYLVVLVSDGITWPRARDLATGMGGHLATIGDADENDFVTKLVKAHPEIIQMNGVGGWLGGYQTAGAAEPGGGWTWVDGTPWSFTAWTQDQPDNTSMSENYLDLLTFDGVNLGWNDDSVGGTERPVIGLTVEFE